MESTKNDNLTKIRTLLNGGARLTVLCTLKRIGTSELRHYVSILRKEGLSIKSEWRQNDLKRWKCYWI